MRINQSLFSGSVYAIVSLAVAVAAAPGAQLTTIRNFTGTNGAFPYGGLIIDSSGNLYGATYSGGTSGVGTVYRLNKASNYSLTRLASLNGTHGSFPWGTLIADADGNLYGSANSGGANNNGTVYKLTRASNYALSAIATFNFANGNSPYGTLMTDSAGNIYGTTASGGSLGQGTVYRLDKANNFALTTLANFGASGGTFPVAGVVADAAGNLYGTTQQFFPNGIGTVYKLDASNNYARTTLVTFNSANGASAESELIIDAAGNLYGTTSLSGPGGSGTVFKLDASNNYALTTIAAFNGTNGSQPFAGLLMDAAGNLFGSTNRGGANGMGTIFKLDASNNYALTTLATFNGTNGEGPFSRLIADLSGHLFGTTVDGGPSDFGTAFTITDAGFVVPEPSSVAVLTLVQIATRRARGHSAKRAQSSC